MSASAKAISKASEGVYAFRMPNNSAAPMIRAGRVVIVNPTRPLEPDYGVVIFRPDESEFIVREFISSDPTQWVVRRWGDAPLAEERLSREEWPIAELIIDVCSE